MSRKKRKKNTFFSSFWRETGKNTGKWASNKVFGNTGWATPRRHVIERGDNNARSGRNRNSDNQRSFVNQTDDLFELERKTTSKITELSKKKFPRTVKGITEMLFEIEVLLKGNKWQGIGVNGDDKHKITNKYADALLMKYKQGVEFISINNSQSPILKRLQKKKKYFQRIRAFRKYRFWLILFVLFLSIILLVYFL
jgi:hypothetical protein